MSPSIKLIFNKGREMKLTRKAKSKMGGVVLIDLDYRYARVWHIVDDITVFDTGNVVFSERAKDIYRSLRKYKDNK